MATLPTEIVLSHAASSRGMLHPLAAPMGGQPIASLRFALPRAMTGVVRVTNPQGATVRLLLSPTLPAGEVLAHWDGFDDAGMRVEKGSYALRLEADGRVLASRIVHVH